MRTNRVIRLLRERGEGLVSGPREDVRRGNESRHRHRMAVVLAFAFFAREVVAGLPARATTASEVCPDIQDPCVVASAVSVSSGSVLDFGGRTLHVTGSGSLRAEAGTLEIRAGELRVDRGGSVQVRGTSSRPGGELRLLVAGDAGVEGTLDVSGNPGGKLHVEATGAVVVGGNLRADSLAGDADGGELRVLAGSFSLGGSCSARGGGAEGFGGDVQIEADGPVIVSGGVDTSGAEGGRISVRSGGSVSLQAGAAITADATSAGGFGGEVRIDLSPGSGDLALAGEISVRGRSGSEDTGGGDGGVVTLRSNGDIVATESARIRAGGGGPDGSGGTVDIDAGGSLQLAAIDASATGIDSGGGSVEVVATGDLIVAGPVVARGGGFDADSILLASRQGQVRIEPGAVVDVSSRMGGSGGSIVVEAGTFDGAATASVLIAGTLLSQGGDETDDFVGDGGDIEVTARRDLFLSGSLTSGGGFPGGSGGDLSLEAGGFAELSGSLVSRGAGRRGFGGSVSISAGSLDFSGEIAAVGTEGVAGEVELSASGPVSLSGRIDVAGDQAGDGGSVSIDTGGALSISGEIVADAGPRGAKGGIVDGSACSVDLSPEGLLSALGDQGLVRLRSPGLIVIEGSLRAGARNELIWRDERPFITGNVSPRAVEIQQSDMPPCAEVETPTPASTPTPTATPTPSPASCQGDCDGDGRVAINELVRGVAVALGRESVSACTAVDEDNDGNVRINELIAAVRNALLGCRP